MVTISSLRIMEQRLGTFTRKCKPMSMRPQSSILFPKSAGINRSTQDMHTQYPRRPSRQFTQSKAQSQDRLPKPVLVLRSTIPEDGKERRKPANRLCKSRDSVSSIGLCLSSVALLTYTQPKLYQRWPWRQLESCFNDTFSRTLPGNLLLYWKRSTRESLCSFQSKSRTL